MTEATQGTESVVGVTSELAVDSQLMGTDGIGLDAGSSAVEVAEAWLAQLADQISVPASDVQDHLLDLWGALGDGPVRSEVERWLTETLRRNLYSVTDINERLEGLLPAS